MTVDLPPGRENQGAALALLLAEILKHPRVPSAARRDAEYERGSETRHDALTVFLDLAQWHSTCKAGAYQYHHRDDIKLAANRALSELLADEQGFTEPLEARTELQTLDDLERYIKAL